MFHEPDFTNDSYPDDIDDHASDTDETDSTCALSATDDEVVSTPTQYLI